MNEKEQQLHLKLIKERGAYWRPYRYTYAISSMKSTMRHGIQRETAHIIRPGFYEFQYYDYLNPRMIYSSWAGRSLASPNYLPRTPENLREVTLCGLLALEPVEADKVTKVCSICHKADISIEEKILKRLASMSRERKRPQRDKRGRFTSKPAL